MQAVQLSDFKKCTSKHSCRKVRSLNIGCNVTCKARHISSSSVTSSFLSSKPKELYAQRILPLNNRILPHSSRLICKSSFQDEFDIFLKYTLVAGSISGIVYSATGALFRSPKIGEEKNENISDFGWGVMCLFSFIPTSNSLGWVFGGIQDEDQAILYYTFATLYAAPFVRCGLNMDSFYWFMLLLGVVHMQVERIAWTEPELIRGLPPSRFLLSASQRVAEILGIRSNDVQLNLQDLNDAFSRPSMGNGQDKGSDHLKEVTPESLASFDPSRQSNQRESSDTSSSFKGHHSVDHRKP